MLKNFLQGLSNESFCLIGDFNCIRDEVERINCIYNGRNSEVVNEFIENLNLLDLDLVNTQYTWFGPNDEKSRLDRILLSIVWYSVGHWEASALGRKGSDHKPLLLMASSCDWGPKPFKVFNCWLKDETLKSIQESHLNCDPITSGLDAQSIIRKFKSLIKSWSLDPKNSIDSRIKSIEKNLDALDAAQNSNKEAAVVKEELDRLYELKGSILRQKARVEWFRGGDRNTKFFNNVLQELYQKDFVVR